MNTTPPPTFTPKTKSVRFDRYASADWVRELQVKDDGTLVYDESFFKLSLEVQKLQALTSLNATLYRIERALQMIESSIALGSPPPADPKKTAAADKARRRAKSLKHSTEVWLKTRRDSGTPSLDLANAGLSVRAKKVAWRLGIDTLDKLAAVTEEALLDQRNCGEGTVKEIKAKLAEHGLSLATEDA